MAPWSQDNPVFLSGKDTSWWNEERNLRQRKLDACQLNRVSGTG